MAVDADSQSAQVARLSHTTSQGKPCAGALQWYLHRSADMQYQDPGLSLERPEIGQQSC